MENDKTQCPNCKVDEFIFADSTNAIGRNTINNFGLKPHGSKRIIIKKCPECGRLTFYLKQ